MKVWKDNIFENNLMKNLSIGRPMKILYLTARQPYPYTKGDQLISYYQIKNLSIHHKVYLVSFYEEFYKECYEEMIKYCEEVILVRNGSISKFISSLKTILNRNSIQSNLFYKFFMKGKMRSIYNRINPDVVHVLSFRMAEYFMDDDINKSIDLVDSYSNNMKMRAMSTKGLKKVLWNLEYYLLKNYERKILKNYKKATLVSKRDLKYFDVRNVVVNPNGVSINETLLTTYNKQSSENNCFNIIFQGNMSYYPNVNAIKYLVDKVLPLIDLSFDYKLFLVGGNISNDIKELKGDKVKVVGYVKNLEEYLSIVDVAVYPIFEATGMQNKVLEAMASKVPCIISPQCIEGINGLENGKNVIVADNEESFANAIKTLYDNNTMRNAIINSAYDLIKKDYSWERNIRTLIKLWEE